MRWKRDSANRGGLDQQVSSNFFLAARPALPRSTDILLTGRTSVDGIAGFSRPFNWLSPAGSTTLAVHSTCTPCSYLEHWGSSQTPLARHWRR